MPIVVAQHGVSGSESLPIAARAAGLAARHSRFPAAHGIHVDPEPDTRGAATALGSSRVIYPQPALASTSASFLVAQSALSPAAALVHANLAGSDLLSSIILVLAAPIPILVSLFLAWLTHLPDRSRPYSRQDGYGQHPQGKASRNPQRRHLRRQHWLMVAAHVLLIATSLNFLLTATLGFLKVLVHIDILSLTSSTESHPQLLSKEVVLGMLNGIASVTAQTTGEAALVYQFARIYPSSSARWRILPMALLFILVRLTAHVSLNTLVIWSIVDHSVSATLRSYQRIAAACFSSSVTAITLLLSATFVHKLSSRWRRHVASQLNAAKSRGLESSAEPLLPTMQRIRAILVASWHHTVLTSIFSLAMTASFPFAQSFNAAYWINLVATTAFKLSFSLGISRSLYHMAYDSVLRHQIQFLATVNPQSRGARGELRRDCDERARRRRRRRAEQPGHGEVQEGDRLSLSSSAASSFMYNSWGSADSDSDRHEGPDSGAETDMQVVVDTAIPLSEWPISTENIETDPHVLSPSGLGGNALPLSPAAVEATSLAVPNHASSPRPSKHPRSRALSTEPPVWDTFLVTPHHQEPWPIRSSVIESDPGHSYHCASSATHAVPKDKKPQEVIDSSQGKRYVRSSPVAR
ncbi:hypothetical protein BCR44DRAFT_177345 [Catenaria anguillulae PL171]|uniref:Uncharacterized protein n=1 Tax=Catenaria anguillulae PL171 TaxID=765915 RepID=A0A1Y2H5V1_9FUNG|nr:hypothetical protein BCR44DRAFT_177345 [Catenaria anguillulae PL171]